MSKSRNKAGKVPAFAPVVMLRPRLDQLFGDPARMAQPDEGLAAELDAVTRGCKPDAVASTLLSAALAAPPAAQARLDQALPAWLARAGHVAALQKLVNDPRRALDPDQHARAAAWLTAAGIETPAALPDTADWFFRAFSAGNEWQSAVLVFWYSHPKHNRVQGLSFLIDWNPPWEGAVKDIMAIPNREPREALREFVDSWRDQGTIPEELDAAQAKKQILTALAVNREVSIRLPRDLIAVRETFMRRVLTLPDAPDTPPFGADDFKYLSANGRTPESIMHREHTVGRIARLDDGTEVLVHPDLAEWDD